MTIVTTDVALDVDVPVNLVSDDAGLDEFLAAWSTADARALDTETHSWQDGGNGIMRVLSAALRTDGIETSWVIDARDVDVARLCAGLEHHTAAGWNATFDEDVLNRAAGRRLDLRWWDAMLADAVCHQGETGFDWYRSLAVVAKNTIGMQLDGKGTVQVSYDADSDLTDEQVRYAARDAVATLRVTDAVRAEVARKGLERACELEMRARPFLAAMKACGMPIDWSSWQTELAEMQTELDEALADLARLTGGGQADIFSMQEKPSWNPDSGPAVKQMLNEHARDLVHAHLGATRGLEKADKVDKDALRAIGGPICDALLAYRDKKKILSTYGDNLAQWIGDDGRMHPEYLQVIGTDTGRLSSRKPNAQNFSPRLKKHFKPASDDRVFCYADLSQAELRFLAQVSGDTGMREAFIAGRDIHVATAERMFGVDMDALADGEPKKFKEYRSKAKTLNFGIVYGLGPVALATSLTLAGVPTTSDEARALLRQYLDAYPGVRTWLDSRDSYVRGLSKRPPAADIEATFALLDLVGPIKSAVTQFKKANGGEPDADELVDALWPETRLRRELETRLGREPLAAEIDAERVVMRDRLEWARSYFAPVVLGLDGVPVGFMSYTETGRQRCFQVGTQALLLAMCVIGCQSDKPGARAFRDSFATRNGITLSRGPKPLSRDELTKVFEDRALRREFVTGVTTEMGDDALAFLFDKALKDRIGAMTNAHRNAPIQGGVADVVLDAYGRLWDALGSDPDVGPVQTVHDSIVLECSKHKAREVAETLQRCLEDAMTALCPDVPAKADADVRTSLDDGDVIETL